RIQRREGAPARSVGAQRTRQTPSVVAVILAACRPFAFPVACRRLGHDRINHKASLEQLIDGGAGAGLDGHGQTGPSGQGLLSLLPAFGVVGEGQLQCDLPLGIDHDQIVVIVGPIQGRKVRQFSPCFHWFRASGLKASVAGRSRSNTTALLGQSSLSDWPAAGRRGQSSCHDPRRVRCACLCPRRGQLFRRHSLRRRRVMHHLPLRAGTGSPRSVVHNSGKRIRCARSKVSPNFFHSSTTAKISGLASRARFYMALFTITMSCTLAGRAATAGELPYAVRYELGDAEFAPGDNITIQEVRGTSDTISTGGTYSVKGTYSLGSRDEANLAFYTSTIRDSGPTAVDPKQHVRIKKGTGSFHLVKTLSSDGYLHVSFYPVPSGSGFGGVYFGQGNRVLRNKGFSHLDHPGNS